MGKLISVVFLLAAWHAVLLHSGFNIYFHRQELRSHYISLAFSLTVSIKHWHHQTCYLSGCRTVNCYTGFFTLYCNIEDMQSTHFRSLSFLLTGYITTLMCIYILTWAVDRQSPAKVMQMSNPDLLNKNNGVIWCNHNPVTTLTLLILSIYLAMWILKLNLMQFLKFNC